MTLNALTRLEPAAAEISPEGWRVLMGTAERVALDMNALDVAMTLNALAKIPAAAKEVSATGWQGLEGSDHKSSAYHFYYIFRFHSTFEVNTTHNMNV